MRLSAHFTLEELTQSEMAARKGIDNRPSEEIIRNLRQTATQLETVRALLGFPMLISSGYRCKQLNTLVGGAVDSAHIQGYAADFICPRYGSPREVADLLSGNSHLYDQLIWEWTWVHISFAPTMRREVYTRNSHGYTRGLA